MKKIAPNKVYYYLVLALTIVLPWGVNLLLHGFLSLLLLFWLKHKFYNKYSKSSLSQPQLWCPILLYSLILAGCLFSHNPTKIISAGSIYLPYLIPILILISPGFSLQERRFISSAFILSSCTNLLVCDIYAITDILVTGKTIVFLASGYEYHKLFSFGLVRIFPNHHPTIAATFALWSISGMFSARLKSLPAPLYTFRIETVIYAILIINIFLLNSIAAIIALILIVLFAIQKYLKSKGFKTAIIYSAVIVLLVFSLGFIYINPLNNEKISTFKSRGLKITDREGERNLVTIRLAKWISYVDIFKKNPITGTSVSDISFVRKQTYLEKGYSNLSKINYNAHNQYLETLTTLGVIGFVFLSIMLIYPLGNQKHSFEYAFFILPTAIIFFTESFLEVQQGMVAFMFFYSFYTKLSHEE